MVQMAVPVPARAGRDTHGVPGVRSKGPGTMKRNSKTWLAMAKWAERKANEAAASDKPWAMSNLRLYQNKMNEWLGEHYRAKHVEELEMSIAFQEAEME